jgi:hypothetical protein
LFVSGAVLAQDYPQHSISIFGVDGLSVDGTREFLERYEKQYFTLHMIDNLGKIIPTGINIALRQAKGEVIICVDGHTLIALN